MAFAEKRTPGNGKGNAKNLAEIRKSFSEFFLRKKLRVPEPGMNQFIITGRIHGKFALPNLEMTMEDRRKAVAIKALAEKNRPSFDWSFGIVLLKKTLSVLAPLPGWVEYFVSKPFEGEMFRILTRKVKQVKPVVKEVYETPLGKITAIGGKKVEEERIVVFMTPEGSAVWEDKQFWDVVFGMGKKRES